MIIISSHCYLLVLGCCRKQVRTSKVGCCLLLLVWLLLWSYTSTIHITSITCEVQVICDCKLQLQDKGLVKTESCTQDDVLPLDGAEGKTSMFAVTQKKIDMSNSERHIGKLEALNPPRLPLLCSDPHLLMTLIIVESGNAMSSAIWYLLHMHKQT